MSELIIQDKQLYLIADREFYEPLTRYTPNSKDFYEPLRRILPGDWGLRDTELWCHCSWPGAVLPAQGWKIHVSATPAHATAILLTVARILIAARVPFKFTPDRTLLMIVNGKRRERGAAGKFITVYPKDTEQCRELLEALYQAAIGYKGPYILSDRRYRDSSIIYYRYGGILPTRRTDASGKAVPVIQGNDGQYIDDERTAYFRMPEGVEDPFHEPQNDHAETQEAGTLKQGRYKIESVLSYSNGGGVYLAIDRETARKVVIKEGRPYANVSTRGLDAVHLLKKEQRLLKMLEPLQIGPKAYDFFFDWEHAYLVEEYLENWMDLRNYFGGLSLALRTRANKDDTCEFYRKYCLVHRRLAEAIQSLHREQVVFSDLSLYNVLVFGDKDPQIKLIDFEAAYEEGVDVPTNIFTPGFAPDDGAENWSHIAKPSGDYYALGSLLLAGLFPMNALLVLDRRAHEKFIRSFQRDLGLPQPLADLIGRLLGGKPDAYPKPEEIVTILSEDYQPAAPSIGAHELDEVDLAQTIDSTMSYIASVADFSREDRLYPGDPEALQTNPLSLGYGACGVAYAMHRIRGNVDKMTMDWILQRPVRREAYSVGLYTGLSGVAWSLLELGLHEEAESMLALTREHHLLWRSPDLFNGAAGWGMTQLRFHSHTRRSTYLEAAREAGKFLLEQRETDDEGRCCWRSPEGLSASFGHGASGIALFLLYLHAATGELPFLEAGRQGMEWVISQGIYNRDGGLTWQARDITPSVTPYLRWGSSGIGRVMLRYWQFTGEDRYASLIDDIHIDCDRKYAIFPGYFFGLAGICEFYLDLAKFDRWQAMPHASVRKLLSGCLIYGLKRERGLAFPGESLSRISCDLGTGGAGIALVMDRYLTGKGACFMLDELLADSHG